MIERTNSTLLKVSGIIALTATSYAIAGAQVTARTPAAPKSLPANATAPCTAPTVLPVGPAVSATAPASIPAQPNLTPTGPAVTTPAVATAPTAAPPAVAPTRPALTVEDAVTRALAANPTMQLAEQRVRKALASEEINGVQRGIKISANAVDVLTTYKTTAAASSVSVQQPGLSGFGIPTVTDQSSGTLYSSTSTSGLTSGVTSGGAGSSTTLSSTLTIIPVTGAPGSTSTSGSSSTGTGAITGTGTGNAPVNGRSVSAPVDALIQKLASATGSGVASSRANAQAVAAGTGSAQYNNYAAGISASKVIDVYGLIGISQDVLKSATTFYRIDRDRTANELALTVKNTYFAALRAQANVLTAQEQVNSAQATVNDATIRFNAGAVAEYDVISAKTTLSNANQSLISARNNVTVQKQTLNNLLGQPLDTEFTLVEPALPTLPANFDPKAAVQAAYGKRPEIQQVNLDITIAQRLTKLASAGMKPTFGVGANVNYTGANPGSDGNYINGALVAQVSIPLDDAGLTRANVRSAREDERTQAIVKDQLTQNIALEVRSALANVVDAQALVAADVEGVRLSRESLRLANVRYQAGAGTLLEVTNAEANLATAEYNLASAQFQLQTAYAAYLRASGLR